MMFRDDVPAPNNKKLTRMTTPNKSIRIREVVLVSKSGGKSGDYHR